jgi:hypothetical protein
MPDRRSRMASSRARAGVLVVSACTGSLAASVMELIVTLEPWRDATP